MPRPTRLSRFDQEHYERWRTIAGLDEAGRGPLAGPVVAAACLIERGVVIRGVNDSKKLSSDERQRLFKILSNHPQVRFAIGEASVEEINLFNIYRATQLAMHRALDLLGDELECAALGGILVDGMILDYRGLPCQKVIKGDAKSQVIAAASICAKVTRDALMCQLARSYPEWGFDQHKGYATPLHLKALQEHGPSKIHREHYHPVKELLKGTPDVEYTLF